MTEIASFVGPDVSGRAPAYPEPVKLGPDALIFGVDGTEYVIAEEAVVGPSEHYDPAVLAAHLRARQPEDPADPLHGTIEALAANLPPADNVNGKGAAHIRDAEFLLSYLTEEKPYEASWQQEVTFQESIPLGELDAQGLLQNLQTVLREVTIADPEVRKTAESIARDLRMKEIPDGRLEDAATILGHILRQPHNPS